MNDAEPMKRAPAHTAAPISIPTSQLARPVRLVSPPVEMIPYLTPLSFVFSRGGPLHWLSKFGNQPGGLERQLTVYLALWQGLLKLLHSSVGRLGCAENEGLQIFQCRKVLQPRVGDLRFAQVK
jgi:hypothetical protein